MADTLRGGIYLDPAGHYINADGRYVDAEGSPSETPVKAQSKRERERAARKAAEPEKEA